MKKALIRSKVNPLQLPELMFAGRASLTFRNQNDGTHMSVKIKQIKDKDGNGRRTVKTAYFYVYISLLNDGVGQPDFVGTIRHPKTHLQYKLAQGLEKDSRMAKALKFIMNAYARPEMLREKNVVLFHEGICVRCGMPLTHPLSISRVKGDDCYDYDNGIKEDPNPSPL